MTDVALLAVGFGVLPLAAILLYTFSDWISRKREVTWGVLAGIVAFVGVAHSMASVLVSHSLFGDETVASILAFLGLVLGGVLAGFVFEGPLGGTEPNRLVWAAVGFLLLHSLSDGFVLGTGFIGGVIPTVRVDAVAVGATAIHRFAEGALVVVAAIAAAWKPRSSFVLLAVALAAVPAAYLPSWIFEATAGSPIRSALQLAVPTFLGSIEASFALFLLVRGFLPLAMAGRGTRWAMWVVVGFVGITLVHFLVE